MIDAKNRLRQLARPGAEVVHRLRRRAAGRPVILMYHRVADLPFDPHLLAVRPSHFAEQLAVLSRGFRIMPLDELSAGLREHRLPRRAVVITIDDGYADSLASAKPLLETFDAPATVFVTTDQIGQSREFWWDELERLVLQPGRLPPVIRLGLGGKSIEWQLGETAAYGPADFERNRWWHVEQGRDPGPRHRLFRSLYERLHPLPNDQKWEVLEQLRLAAGFAPDGRATHRALDERELAELGHGHLIELGAHSATHPALGGLPTSIQEDEIERSRQRLDQIVGRPITSFAYPHGSYTEETIRAVARAGFARACTSDPQIVEPGGNPLALPRIVPRDWDGAEFARWLSYWTG